jgi:hypothetical protein
MLVESIANLTSAPGGQDHTISPSARAPLVLRRSHGHRIPPRVRDDAYAPLAEAGHAQRNRFSEKKKDKFSRGRL